METVDRFFHLADIPAFKIALVRGKEGQGIVAPIVREAFFDQIVVVRKGMDRQQLNRGHTKLCQMLDHRLGRQRGKSAAISLHDAGVLHRQAFDMRLVDDGFVPAGAQGIVAVPLVIVTGNNAFWHELRRVPVVKGQIVFADLIAEQGIIPDQLAHQRAGIWVKQQLVWIKPVAIFWIVGAMHTVAITLADFQAGHKAVPNAAFHIGQGDAGRLILAGFVVQTQLNLFGGVGKEGEVDAIVARLGAHFIGPGQRSIEGHVGRRIGRHSVSSYMRRAVCFCRGRWHRAIVARALIVDQRRSAKPVPLQCRNRMQRP